MTRQPRLTREAREFVDRTALFAAFDRAAERVSDGTPFTLGFYGVGGVGKTRLRQELALHAQKTHRGAIVGTHDFACPELRSPLQGLYALARSISGDLQSDFPRFNAAHETYWRSTHAEARFAEDPLRSGLAGGLSRAVDYAEAAGIPAVRLVHNLVDDAVSLLRQRKSRGIDEVSELPELEPVQVLELLPVMFAHDLNDIIARRRGPLFVLLDTYEALWEGDRRQAVEHLRDGWVREAVRESPSALWTICGRERLTWDTADESWNARLEQHLVGGLDREYCERFLVSTGITDSEVRSVIIDGSEGLPFYLDLASDTYAAMLDQDHQPEPEDFVGTYGEMYERFVRYLSDEELLTLKVLACATTIDRPLWNRLLERFETGYPRAGMNRLMRFSFFDVDDGVAKMHDLMRAHLQDRLAREDRGLYEDVHHALVEYALDTVAALDARRQPAEAYRAVSLGYYSAKAVMEPDDLVPWYRGVLRSHDITSFRATLVDVDLDLVGHTERRGASAVACANAWHILALAQWARRSTGEAETAARRALVLDEKAGRPLPMDTARMLNTLGLTLQQGGRYEEAEPYYRESLEIRRRELEPDHPLVARLMNNYAGILGLLGRADEGLDLALEALDARRRSLHEPDPDIANSFSTIGQLYLYQGRLAKSEEALREGIRQYDETYGAVSMPSTMSRVALSQVLAGSARNAEAEALLRDAVALCEGALGRGHPAAVHVAELLERAVDARNRGDDPPAG
jgi:tetratricopeptide (TPR) repeat protein